jgi:hypothetical protein
VLKSKALGLVNRTNNPTPSLHPHDHQRSGQRYRHTKAPSNYILLAHSYSTHQIEIYTASCSSSNSLSSTPPSTFFSNTFIPLCNPREYPKSLYLSTFSLAFSFKIKHSQPTICFLTISDSSFLIRSSHLEALQSLLHCVVLWLMRSWLFISSISLGVVIANALKHLPSWCCLTGMWI